MPPLEILEIRMILQIAVDPTFQKLRLNIYCKIRSDNRLGEFVNNLDFNAT